MQTHRHWVFAALAVCSAGCSRSLASGDSRAADQDAVPRVQDALVTPSDPPRVRGRPEVQAAAITGWQEIVLHFTEPVFVQDGVRPDQFCLSLGQANLPGGYVAYYDFGEYLASKGSADVIQIERVDEDSLRLVLGRPLPGDGCESVNAMREELNERQGEQAGVYLHYREVDAAITEVESLEYARQQAKKLQRLARVESSAWAQ